MSPPMSRWLKLLISLLVALLIAWLSFGPLGRGAAYVERLQGSADAVLEVAGVPGVRARVSREPLSRTVFLCGPANDFQRDGTTNWEKASDLPGLDGRMYAVGLRSVVWDPPAPGPNAISPPCRADGPGPAGGGLPLLVEIMGMALLAWLIGLGLGWLFFRPRPPRTGYLS